MRVPQLFDLSGRSALVTGGGRGSGRHIALGLAEAGADVVVASRKREACEEVAKAIEGLGRRGLALELDLRRPDSIEALAERVLAGTGRLHVLVNNAGFAWGEPLLEHSLEGFDRVFETNVRGPFLLTQRVARHMKERGGGSILNVSSISAYRGAPDADEPSVAYAASKGALNTLTKDMAVKLAPFGIRVNAIAPGPFSTDMMNHIRHDERRLREFEARIPLGRCGGEDDIKGAAVFLASDAGAFVTGQTLIVDGGWLVAAR